VFPGFDGFKQSSGFSEVVSQRFHVLLKRVVVAEMEILIESSLQKFVIGDNLKLSALVVFSDELLLVFGKDSLEDIC
jgi:hypothetical protein